LNKHPYLDINPPEKNYDSWPAFILPWDDMTTGLTDMSRFLEKPAGATGFIKVVNGHLATGDGKRWRVWGHMFSGNAPLPSMDEAPKIARRFAKFGLNCVRLHHIDHRWPDGIIIRHTTGKRIPGITINNVAYRDDEPTRSLDPEAMARLDWFIYHCKLNGIYIDLNLNVSRAFTTADGVKEAELIGLGKGLTYLDDQLIALQKEYARQVLEHVNPFTGNRYAEEPAIAFVELVNENSILENWQRGLLVPVEGEERDSGAWAHIPPSYARDLDTKWNRWLEKRYPHRVALLAAWQGELGDYEDASHGTVRRLKPEEFESTSTPRFCDEARFLLEMEQDFFIDMQSFLRGQVGTRQLIIGTSDHSRNWSAIPQLESNSILDVMDGHDYWIYPRQVKRASKIMHWDPTPMVDCPDSSIPTKLSRTLVKGKPYVVSEVNEAFPRDSACEMIPIVTAYGLLQDWDGIMWCKYRGHYHAGSLMGPGPTWSWDTQAVGAYLSMYADPMKMSQLAIGALMWHRGDVQAARGEIERAMPHNWALESLRVKFPDQNHPYWIPYLPGRLSLVHRTVIADFHADRLLPEEGSVVLPQGKIVSDTGELIWENTPDDGRVLIDTPCHQGMVMRAGTRETTNLIIHLQTRFSAIQVASLDEQPLSRTSQMLLVAVSRVANTGQKWEDNTRTRFGSAWGGPPTRIEPVQATLILKNLEGASRALLQPLDGRGQPFEIPLQAHRSEEGFVFHLSAEPGTTWYNITIER